jgi:hypothetical protein
MPKQNYDKYIFTEYIPKDLPNYHRGGNDPKSGVNLIRIDGEILDGAFTLGAKWFWPIPIPPIPLAERSIGIEPHKHDYEEVLVHFGTNWEDPSDLGAELELWIEDEKHIITKSCLIVLPKGLKHGPIGFNRIDSPVYHSTCGVAELNLNKSLMNKKKYGEYIITEFKPNLLNPAFHVIDSKHKGATEILRFDSGVMDGDFYVLGKWYWPSTIPNVPLKNRPDTRLPQKHDYDEILGFFGTNWDTPNDLGGELEVWLEDEKYTLTKSCEIYIPKGMKHGPIGFNRIDRAILHNACGRAKI